MRQARLPDDALHVIEAGEEEDKQNGSMNADRPLIPCKFGSQIGRIARHWRAEIDRRLQDAQVTEAMLSPLLQLAHSDRPMRQKDLAEALALDSSSLVRVLGNLEEAGLIRRQRDENDRRSHALSVTDKGYDLALRISEISCALERDLIEGFPEAEAQTTLRVLRQISDRLVALREDAREAAALPDPCPDPAPAPADIGQAAE